MYTVQCTVYTVRIESRVTNIIIVINHLVKLSFNFTCCYLLLSIFRLARYQSKHTAATLAIERHLVSIYHLAELGDAAPDTGASAMSSHKPQVPGFPDLVSQKILEKFDSEKLKVNIIFTSSSL